MNHCVPDWSFSHDHPRNSHSKSPRPVDELIELLWQDGHVVMNSQAQRKVMVTPNSTTQCTEPEQVSKGYEPFKNLENVLQEETGPWAQCSVDDSFENEFCQAFFSEHLRAASTSTHTTLAAEGDKIIKHMAPTRSGISEEHSSVAEQPIFSLFGKKPMPVQSRFASPLLHVTNRNAGDLRNFTHFKRLPEIEKLPLNRALGKSSMGYHVEPGESSSKMTKESSICASNQVHSLFYPSPRTTTKVASAEGLEDDACAVIADDKETCDINETVNTTSSGASIGRTGQQNRQMIMHKRKGREGDEPECQSEEADGASVEKNMQFQRSSSARRRRAAEVHNLSERKRRDRINRKMRDLQELIPHCNKADKASMLDEAIEYLKSLQLQVQIMWMRSGMVPMMFPGVHPFMPQIGMGMENTFLPSVQSPQHSHVPLVNQSVASNIDVNHVLLSPSDINQVNFRTQMQNVLIPGSFTHCPGFQHMQPCPQMLNVYTSGSQLMQQNQAAFANSNLAPRVDDTSPVKAQYDSSGKSA